MSQDRKTQQKAAWALDLVASAWFVSVGVFFSVALLA